jgi:hypothetical protein
VDDDGRAVDHRVIDGGALERECHVGRATLESEQLADREPAALAFIAQREIGRLVLGREHRVLGRADDELVACHGRLCVGTGVGGIEHRPGALASDADHLVGGLPGGLRARRDLVIGARALLAQRLIGVLSLGLGIAVHALVYHAHRPNSRFSRLGLLLRLPRSSAARISAALPNRCSRSNASARATI